MKCYRCKIAINSDYPVCPLCQTPLRQTTKTSSVFPIIPNYYRQHKVLYKVLLFLSLLGIATCTIINILINEEISWSLFVTLGIICFWLTLTVTMKKNKYFMKKLFKQFNLIIILAIIWDYFTGWHGFSIDYVLPFTCISYTLIIVIMRLFFKYYIRDNILYVICNCLIGMVPSIFLLLNITKEGIPSLISIFLSIIIVLILMVFNRKSVWNEFQRRFHI